MKEHPILFSGEMVRAILDGRKTQTRRVVKGETLEWLANGFLPSYVASPGNFLSPYGFTGDRLWVRETWAAHPSLNHKKPSEIPDNRVVHFRADPAVNETHYMWRPSIYMPRWASRITLEIVDVRMQRVQDISMDDCVAEGMPANEDPYNGYAVLWDEINEKRGYPWFDNPWVWVIEFKQVEVQNGA